MKRCTNCGVENPDDAIFCRSCGNEVKAKKIKWWMYVLILIIAFFIAGIINLLIAKFET